jgi:shikimate kinase
MMKIILLGYMGSGKSTIATFLSEKLQLPSFDLDYRIEKLEGMTISSLFQTKGEIYFRKVEHQVFAEVMHSTESFVLSLGGGTPCYANNHLLLNGEAIISIYLKKSIDNLFLQLKDEKASRPILADKSDEVLKVFIAQHLFERSYFYNQATYTINTDLKSPQEIVSEIEKLLL